MWIIYISATRVAVGVMPKIGINEFCAYTSVRYVVTTVRVPALP